eukprot:3755932-Prymnesium_polylepis.1
MGRVKSSEPANWRAHAAASPAWESGEPSPTSPSPSCRAVKPACEERRARGGGWPVGSPERRRRGGGQDGRHRHAVLVSGRCKAARAAAARGGQPFGRRAGTALCGSGRCQGEAQVEGRSAGGRAGAGG